MKPRSTPWRMLRPPRSCSVSRPQGAALREAERTSNELRAIGVGNQCLVVNGTFETDCPEDVTAQAMQQRGLLALTAAGEFIRSMPSFIVPLRPINILGIGGLRVSLSGDVHGKCETGGMRAAGLCPHSNT